MTDANQLILKIATDFPNASTRAIARMAYAEAPELFTTENAARQRAKAARGAGGKFAGAQFLDKTPFKAEEPWGSFPEGKKELGDWKPLVISGHCHALVLGDLHIPFHDRKAIIATLDHGKKNAVDTIILNGDTSDFYSVSFWVKDPRKRRFAEEIKTVREFLHELRDQFPKARIIYKLGNHEERFETYMRVKAPELLGVRSFTVNSLLGLKNVGIELVEDKRPIRLGQLNVVHGHEYRFAISNPVNPARGLFLRAKAYAVCNHFHQKSEHSSNTIEHKRITTWSLGCLCNLHPEYAPFNEWSHGFGDVEVFDDGKFNFQNKAIGHNGKVY